MALGKKPFLILKSAIIVKVLQITFFDRIITFSHQKNNKVF